MLTQTTTVIETNIVGTDGTQAPEPIRVIRRRNERSEFAILASEAQMTEAERRAAYVAMFNPCGAA